MIAASGRHLARVPEELSRLVAGNVQSLAEVLAPLDEKDDRLGCFPLTEE
jgi:hypothetical protein